MRQRYLHSDSHRIRLTNHKPYFKRRQVTKALNQKKSTNFDAEFIVNGVNFDRSIQPYTSRHSSTKIIRAAVTLAPKSVSMQDTKVHVNAGHWEGGQTFQFGCTD